jgi:hypothetical protein
VDNGKLGIALKALSTASSWLVSGPDLSFVERANEEMRRGWV